MCKFGGWEAKFNKNFPQKIASTVSGDIKLLGATYNAVAYLGSQQVNGTNHAVLAEQTVLCGKDVKNAVVMVFNEKADSQDVSLVSIRTIVEAGGKMGGTDINVTTDIPAAAIDALSKAMEGFVGLNIKPVAFLGSQLVHGTNWIILAEVTGVYPNAKTELAIITVNDYYKKITFNDLFETASEEAPKFTGVALSGGQLGYAFTWLKKSLGAPLGEWP